MDRDTGLIRTDQIGRLRFTPDQRRVLLDAFEHSGQSASGFAVTGRADIESVFQTDIG